MKKILFYFPLLLILISCEHNNPDQVATQKTAAKGTTRLSNSDIWAFINVNKPKIKDGDLIERSDDDLVSESLRGMSQTDKTFSHSGIAFVEDGNVYVYNNMAGAENKSEQMMREPFDSFVSPSRKDGFGIFRYQLADDERVKIHAIIKDLYDRKLLFDKSFDLKTDDKQYCSEMIYKALKKATNNRVLLPTSKVQNFKLRDPKYKGMMLKEFEYVALDNLFLNPYCSQVVRISYNK